MNLHQFDWVKPRPASIENTCTSDSNIQLWSNHCFTHNVTWLYFYIMCETHAQWSDCSCIWNSGETTLYWFLTVSV